MKNRGLGLGALDREGRGLKVYIQIHSRGKGGLVGRLVEGVSRVGWVYWGRVGLLIVAAAAVAAGACIIANICTKLILLCSRLY